MVSLLSEQIHEHGCDDTFHGSDLQLSAFCCIEMAKEPLQMACTLPIPSVESLPVG